MITLKCQDCGRSFSGRSEHAAEVKYNAHVCPASEKFEKMSLGDLRKYIESGKGVVGFPTVKK